MPAKVSDSTIRRLSHYLRILEAMARDGGGTVSSVQLAAAAGTTAAQVRKDLSLFGSFGKRGHGYQVAELADRVREILGLGRDWRVALVGAGRIGSALFEYADFRRRGFHIVAVLDVDPAKIGERWGTLAVEDVASLEAALEREGVEVLIVTVPATEAQAIVDRAVASGVRGILNFAPTQLRTEDGVFVHDVNMVMELEALSFDLTNRIPADVGDTAD
ncbi:MAG: redox-sensing transcriptional repressor Rex [Gemmatimonadetes bacterium]|nr:redox-sensing transcriptional repressor Rex [Gemmatimonadota bacterium]MBT8405701.1 redox-sensing transcriptional repressor Rex [Gemmatimonadota bacterium]NNK62355.1 redox-sensing transcriptional repressor Rex [Gemmatimonadota bacterium]